MPLWFAAAAGGPLKYCIAAEPFPTWIHRSVDHAKTEAAGELSATAPVPVTVAIWPERAVPTGVTLVQLAPSHFHVPSPTASTRPLPGSHAAETRLAGPPSAWGSVTV